jgi:hypothetical protein
VIARLALGDQHGLGAAGLGNQQASAAAAYRAATAFRLSWGWVAPAGHGDRLERA